MHIVFMVGQNQDYLIIREVTKIALLKEKTFNSGITADYWKIIDCDVKKSKVCIAAFIDREHASDRNNLIDSRVAIDIEWDLEALDEEDMNPLKYAYLVIKESKMSVWTDEETDGPEEDFVSVETNWFADAEDV